MLKYHGKLNFIYAFIIIIITTILIFSSILIITNKLKNNSKVNPCMLNPEICDGKDNNCDHLIDEGCTQKINSDLILKEDKESLKCDKIINGTCWKLVWFDDFDYEGLPDPTKWDYEEGFIRNEQMQYFTHAREENARVENGALILEARKETFSNPRYNPNSQWWVENREYAEYTSASLITLNKKEFLYGRIETRAKLPYASGVHPAIWTMGTVLKPNSYSEIDIMEFYGRNPTFVHANAHYKTINGTHLFNISKLYLQEPISEYSGFHIFAIEWYPDRIDFFFDNIKYHTFYLDDATNVEGDNYFRKPHYFLLGLPIEGNNVFVNDTAFPQQFIIDYVRVYELKD